MVLVKEKERRKKNERADFENNMVTPSKKCIRFKEQDFVATA